MTPVPVNRIHPSLAWNRGSQRLPAESCIVGQFFTAAVPPDRQLNFSTLSPSAPGTCLNEKTWEGICRPVRKAFLSLSFVPSLHHLLLFLLSLRHERRRRSYFFQFTPTVLRNNS